MKTSNLNSLNGRKHLKYSLFTAGACLLALLISVALAQDLSNQIREKRLSGNEWRVWAKSMDTHILVENGPLHMLGSEKFREDLQCQIHLGSYLYPCFNTKGDQDRLKEARIDLDPWNSVSVVRRQAKDNSYLLYLFTEDDDGKIMTLFDLNMDGVWDVKDSPNSKKRFIFFEKEWLEVDKIDGRNSEKPTAVKDRKHYEFLKSWKLTRQ